MIRSILGSITNNHLKFCCGFAGRVDYHRNPFSSKSSSSPSSSSKTITGPTQKLTSWESGAQMIKNPKIDNQYMEHMRDLHDPTLHIKTIEDELKGTIGKALGKQGEKILMYARLMHTEREKYEELMFEKKQQQQQQQHNNDDQQQHVDDEIQKCVKQHNQYRKDCLHARWELIVHRQAAGFIVGNHQYVTEKFPIADALPEVLDGR